MAPPPSRIHLSPPHVTGDEQAWLHEVLAAGWVAPAGPYLAQFEQALCAATQAAHAVAMSSGTAALHLALLAVGVQPGDAVISPSLTFAGGVNPIRYAGAEPVFVDSEAYSWNLDPHWLEVALRTLRKQGHRVGAIVATHLYGRVAAMDAIAALCEEYRVPLVEDAAEALGATSGGRPIGQWGQATALSFNGNKVVTTGGGGALLTADARIAERVRHWATQAREPAPHYEHRELGYNYRMNGLAAAFGLGQLPHLGAFVARRRAIHAAYRAALQGLDGVRFLPERTDALDSHWLTVLAILPNRMGVTRDQLIDLLASFDIEARPVWKPMHLQPLYADRPFFGGQVAAEAFATGLCLPSGSTLTDAQMQRICNILRSAWGCRMP